MNALDSPVEALALDYVSYGFFTAVNNLLAAWIAAVTAAFSFWRIGPSSPPRPEQRGRTKDAASASCAPLVDRGQEEIELADEPAKLVSTQGGTNCNSAFETDICTKGKFVMYYRNDDSREGGVDPVDGVAAAAIEKFRRWSDMDWEREWRLEWGTWGGTFARIWLCSTAVWCGCGMAVTGYAPPRGPRRMWRVVAHMYINSGCFTITTSCSQSMRRCKFKTTLNRSHPFVNT